MTLLDLWGLVKKSWWLVVALPIVCALACWGVLSAEPATYAASATLVSSDQLAVLNGQAASVAAQRSTEEDMSVSTVLNGQNFTITVTATGENPEGCVRMANEVATAAREKTLAFVAQQDDARTPIITITEAVKAYDISPKKTQYVVVAFVAGLLAAICLIIARDMARGSIHNAYEVEEKYGLRQLGRVRKASSKRRSGAVAEEASLLAALDFAGEGKPAICLVPMEDSASAKRIVTELESVAETAAKRLACVGENANLTLSDPDALTRAIVSLAPADADLVFVMAPAVADSADFAYLAPACGCAVLVLEAMRTKRAHLESALRQLSLSETEVAGFIMVNAA